MGFLFGPWVWQEAINISDRYWLAYTFFAAIYLPGIWWLKRYMKDRKPFDLRTTLISYNWFLALFNAVVVYYSWPHIWHYAQKTSWENTLCSSGVLNGEGGRWIFLFGLFKIPEMLDTVFLAVRKKTIILLHWYHHLSVMLFCWYMTYSYIYDEGGEAALFAGMNAFIHVIMYGYYALMAMRIKMPRGSPQFITMIQIIQMIFGIALETYKLTVCKEGRYLSGVWAGMAMYISYFVLFGMYYADRYIFGRKVAAD